MKQVTVLFVPVGADGFSGCLLDPFAIAEERSENPKVSSKPSSGLLFFSVVSGTTFFRLSVLFCAFFVGVLDDRLR
jgi:hypothetical protein